MADRPLSVVTEEYSGTIVSADAPEPTQFRGIRWKRAIKWLLLIVLGLWIADAGISLLIDHTALHRKLTARLAAVFGRPVNVGRYNFSLWTGPTLEATSVTVGEDPRFGQEYFLRAESLRVRLRWGSFLRGHLELGTLLLSQPSLNVVRDAGGDWNLAEWLPRPAVRGNGGAQPGAAPALPLQRIEVESGRVNFKRGDVKLPFALVGVQGAVQSDGTGRWRMDVEAIPWRASVVTQQAGVIHIAGHLGGTSSRLLPAVLDSSWTDASISDALRLMKGDDYGVRGALSVLLSARANDEGWKLQGRAEMRQIHRWDLPLRADNPALNLIAQMKVGTNGSTLEVTDAKLEAPHSNARGSARFSWNESGRPAKDESQPFRAEVTDLSIDAGDFLSWVRAFHGGMADNLSIRGTATAQGVAAGWPLHLENATLTTEGADLRGPDLRVAAHMTKAEVRYDRDRLTLSPLTLSLGAPKAPPLGSFRMEQIAAPRSKSANWRLSGSIDDVRDLILDASSLGWSLSKGWGLAGPFRCDLRWQAPQTPWSGGSAGFLELGGAALASDGASLRSAFLNQPIDGIKVRADWKPGVRHVTLSSAQAFGAHWTGTFNRRDVDDQWQFAISGDRLATSDVDLWLNPRWRESLIDRVLPFLNPRATASAAPEDLRASGRFSLDQLTLAPITLHRLQGALAVNGRHMELTDAAAQFYGGTVNGMFISDLKAIPSYQINADFAQVDLSALAAASPSFAELFGGSASGQVFVTAHGASRPELASSLQCRGSANVDNPELQAMNLADSLRDAALRPGTSLFREGSAAFTCGAGKIQFHDFALIGAEEDIDGVGSIDFSHSLDFRLNVIRNAPSGAASLVAQTPIPRDTSFQVSGPLNALQFTRISASQRRAR